MSVNNVYKKIIKINSSINRIIDLILVFLMGTIIVVIFLQVFSRYILRKPFGWTNEIAIYMFIWMVFFGTYRLLRNNEHISVDLLYVKLGTNWQKICSILFYLTVILMAIILMIYGFIYARTSTSSYSSYLQISFGLIYAILPIAGFLFFTFAIENLLKIIFTFRRKKN